MAVSWQSIGARVLLVVALSIIGIAIGGWVAMGPAARSEPLVGGAVIMLGAMIGGAVGFLGGAFLAWKLPPTSLRIWMFVLGAPALVLFALGLRALWLADQQTRDPEEAYSGLPVFVAVLERDPTHDPYLAPRVEVNAKTRTWTNALPDGRACSGRLRAEVQRRVAAALPSEPVPEVCGGDAPVGSYDRISWRVDGASAESALLDDDCRKEYPSAVGLAHIVSRASGLAASSASCD